MKVDTLFEQTIQYGKHNFVQVARTKIGDNIYLSISKGYFKLHGDKVFVKNVTVPMNVSVFPEKDDIEYGTLSDEVIKAIQNAKNNIR